MSYFAYESPRLWRKSKVALREFVSLFPSNAYSVTTIVGVVRSRGADAADRRLAVQRAGNTKRFLRVPRLRGIVNITSGAATDAIFPARFPAR